MDRLIEECLKRLDECVHEVRGAWDSPARSDPEFRDVLDKADTYNNAKQTADNLRELNALTEQMRVRVNAAGETFCKAYAAFLMKRPSLLKPQIRHALGLE